MSGVLDTLRDVVKMDAALMIVHAAKLAGRDPMQALGIPEELPMMPEVALLLGELLNPRQHGKSEAEYDEDALRIQARMDLRDSWTQATRTGYQGPRGQFGTVPPTVEAPAPAPLTPCYVLR